MITDKIFYVEKEQLFYDWNRIEKIPEFAVLKKCEQNPRWHSEGNCWNHTKLVCEAMEKKLKSMRYTYKKHPNEVRLLMTAALFHDVGKGVTTTYKKGNWHAYGHEVEGEKSLADSCGMRVTSSGRAFAHLYVGIWTLSGFLKAIRRSWKKSGVYLGTPTSRTCAY